MTATQEFHSTERTIMTRRFALGVALALAAMAMTASSARAATIFVDADATLGANDGTSWADAYTDLQLALAAATPPDEIWVAEGTYKPHASDITVSFELFDGAVVYGGFDGTEVLLGDRAGLFDTTILSGDLLDNDPPGVPDVFAATRDDNSELVVEAFATTSILLDGFTVTGGGDGTPASGAGMEFLVVSTGTGTVTNCIFRNNGALGISGGVLALSEVGGSLTISKCTFTENFSFDQGAGVYLDGAGILLDQCLVHGNVADGSGGDFGGGIYVVDNFVGSGNGNITIRNCTITDNAATDAGGGIYYDSQTSSLLTIQNSIIAGNSAAAGTGQNFDDSPFILGIVAASDSLIGGFLLAGPGYPTVLAEPNPLFADAAGGDFGLSGGSPCIDVGDNGVVDGGVTTDFAGDPRFVDDTGTADTGAGTPPIVDMGAFEFQGTTSATQIIYVDADATGSDDGTSWTHAYETVQDALANLNATGHSEIRVAEGMYYPDEGSGQVDDDRTSTFTLTSLTQLYGGYAGFGEADPDLRDPVAHVTVLSGDIQQDDCCSKVGFFINTHHVVTANGVNSTTVLDGFTVENGNTEPPLDRGGGLLAVGGSPQVANCIFSRSEAGDAGGGAYVSGAQQSSFRNCLFVANQTIGTGGAGLYVVDSHVDVVNCVFKSNLAFVGIGGGIYLARYTGGLFNQRIVNCTFAENFAGVVAGGLFDDNGGIPGPGPLIANSIFWGNFSSSSETFDQENSQIVANDADVSFSIIQFLDGFSGNNNVADDPFFVDPGGLDGFPSADDDVRVLAGSPAIDAGSADVLAAEFPAVTTDLAGNPRNVDDPGITRPAPATALDMGAYEFQGTTSAPILYVDDSAGGANDGSSWTDAFTTLQAALAAAAPNTMTQIWVAAGTYEPDSGGGQTPGDRAATFQLSSFVELYGGFAGGETMLSERNPLINEAILTGDLLGDDPPTFPGQFGVASAENSFHVVTCSSVNSSAILDGFTVIGGRANGVTTAEQRGGGMYNTNCRAQVRNCKFESNLALDIGAGMYNESVTTLTVDVCVFRLNVAGRGGGMGSVDQGTRPQVNASRFLLNGATNGTQGFGTNGPGDGAGVYNRDCDMLITNSEFAHNEGNNRGGGMANVDASEDMTITVVNCTFAENKTIDPLDGAGMWSQYGNASLTTIDNSIFWENSAFGASPAGESDQILSSALGTDVRFSLIWGLAGFAGNGNIDADPLFLDTNGADDFAGSVDDDFTLLFESPAIDAGDNDPANALGLTTDLKGKTRFFDDEDTVDTGNGTAPIVDMGAIEFTFAFGLGDELPPPTDLAFVIDLNPNTSASGPVGGTCGGGSNDGGSCTTDDDCPSDMTSAGACLAGAFYHTVEGKWYANEPGLVTMTWAEVDGGPGSVDVSYIVGPVANDDNPRTRLVRYFPNYDEAVPSINGDPVVHYNSVMSPDCNGDVADDFIVQSNGNLTIQETACMPAFGQDPRHVIFEYNEFGTGNLLGFEIVFVERIAASIQSDDEAQVDFLHPVGRLIPGPDANEDYVRAEVIQPGFVDPPFAWQRVEEGGLKTTDIYPIRPQIGSPANEVVVWFRQSTVADLFNPSIDVPMGQWPIDVTRYQADWPEIVTPLEPSQTNVVDVSKPVPVVNLRLGDLYSSVEVMYEEGFDGSSTPFGFPQGIVAFDPFIRLAGDPGGRGYSVLKFECSTACDDVTFEVIRTYHHNESGPVGDEVFVAGSNPMAWDVGTSIEQPSLHDSATPAFPFGYLHDGQVFAPCIYGFGAGGDVVDPSALCDPLDATGQIIPVNESNMGGSPEHGLMELWYFEQGRDVADGNFAGEIRWPHVVHTYDVDWPTTDCSDPVGNPQGCDKLIIASRLGHGDMGLGLGGYGIEATIYKAGQPGDDLATQSSTQGWNPNDEHASLIPIGNLRAFATRDDSPWEDPSGTPYATGHPYVLVQYWDDVLGKWDMDVKEVVAELAPFTFNYSQFASASETGIDFSPVPAGLPLNPPLFPVNFSVISETPCNEGTEPLPITVLEMACDGTTTFCDSDYDCNVCTGGTNANEPCANDLDCPEGSCPGVDCKPTGALWADRTGQLWTINDQTGTVELYERWGQDGDNECEPYLDNDSENPQDIVYDPSWPPICSTSTVGPCALDASLGSTVDLSAACSLDILYDGVNTQLIDPGLTVSVEYPELPPDFGLLLPYLASGKDGDNGTFPDDRISWASGMLSFTGIMSNDDAIALTDNALFGGPAPTVYTDAIAALKTASRAQLLQSFDPATEPSFQNHLAFTDDIAVEEYVTVAIANDFSCGADPVDVRIYSGGCPPAQPAVKIFNTACPFGETVVLQVNHDILDFPNDIIYQWQFKEIGDPTWTNLHANNAEALGTRELVISGSAALADKMFRVRYRGFSGCACDASPVTCLGSCTSVTEVCVGGANDGLVCVDDDDCPTGVCATEVCSGGSRNGAVCVDDDDCLNDCCPTVGATEEDWPTLFTDDGSAVSDWSATISMQGWLKRLVDGLNPFDERISNLHDAESLNFTYLTMLENAGVPFDGNAILSCSPENLQNIGLIEAYSSAAQRAESFTIAQRPATTAESLAILFITAKIADLNVLLGNEAVADATDPTTGVDASNPLDPVSVPSALYAFEGEVGSPLDEELALLRGVELDQGFPLHNRIRWNFGPLERAEAAYVSTYNLVDKDGDGFIQLSDAQITFPQGHGDAWGHFLTTMKKYYRLLRHNNFEWIVATETIPSGTGSSTPVRFQYERRFAQSAAAKARAGADIVDLTFRQKFDGDPTTDPGFPDSDTDRAWGLNGWARRAGQGAYFDWVTANALLDDDDSGNTGLERVDRTTVPELKQIASAYARIQAAVTNSGNGLNPLGLAANVVPFGINAEALDAGTSHYEQVRCWAVQQLDNAAVLFDYANDNIRRLRTNEDDANDFAVAVGEEESDFTARLIEIYGRPYPESIGIPGGYPAGYDGPDIFFFDYVDPSTLLGSLLGDTNFTTDAFSSQITRTFTDYDGTIFPEDDTDPTIEVTFNVSTVGFGMIKPEGWSSRPEPGEIQLAKSELLQAVGELQQALLAYQGHLDNIDAEIDAWSDLTAMNSSVLTFLTDFEGEEQNLNSSIRKARDRALAFQLAAEASTLLGDGLSEAIPSIFGFSNDVGAIAKGAVKIAAIIPWTIFTGLAGFAELDELRDEQSLDEAATALEIDITTEAQNFEEEQQIRVIEQLLRETPAVELAVRQQVEAIRQAEGLYLQALGEGARLLDQRALFRTRFASTATDYRYKDLTFRLLRNESLQKYRAMFDLASRYVFLAAKAYDYETNLLGVDAESARGFLASVVKQRTLGVVPSNIACGQALPPPVAPNGLADLLGSLDQQFAVIQQNRFVGDINRSFKLRRQLFRVVGDDDEAWRAALARFQVNDLNNVLDYRLFASQLQGFSGPNSALVIPFSTTVNEGLNFFGWRLNGPDFPSGRYAIKLSSYEVHMHDMPAEPLLNPFIDVFLLPVGSDIMRTPQGPDGGKIRVWNLLDQTLPPAQPIGGAFTDPDWVPWDTWTAAGIPGDPRLAVQRRRLPSIGACDPDFNTCDTSSALVGRSVWNTRWLLIIPGSSLSHKVAPEEAIDMFINGTDTVEGVSDIELIFNAVGYDLNTGFAPGGGPAPEGPAGSPIEPSKPDDRADGS
jgi:hypothetical protein